MFGQETHETRVRSVFSAGWVSRMASFLHKLSSPGPLPRAQKFTRKTNSEKFTKHLDFNLLLEMSGYFLSFWQKLLCLL